MLPLLMNAIDHILSARNKLFCTTLFFKTSKTLQAASRPLYSHKGG